MLTPPQALFLTLAADAAVASEKMTGVPASLSLAQSIFESGWGAHTPFNNVFGLKANGRGCGNCVVPTREFVDGQWTVQNLAFEKYASLTDCFNDHGWLISQGAPYASAFAQFKTDGNTDSLILSIGRIYATAPGYGQTILTFTKSDTIQQAILAARSRASIPS